MHWGIHFCFVMFAQVSFVQFAAHRLLPPGTIRLKATYSCVVFYQDLLDPARWRMLIQQFRYDNYRLHQLGNNSVFTITLQAGLSAIKTPYPLMQILLGVKKKKPCGGLFLVYGCFSESSNTKC